MVSLVEYLDRRLGRHTGSGPEYSWFCPACIDREGSDSATPKLHVNVDKAVGHCFRCEYGFRSFERLFRYMNGGTLSLEESRILRRTKKRKSLREALADRRKPVKLKPVPLPPERVDTVSTSAARARAYLAKRGVSKEKIDQFRIQFCPYGRYAGYLLFPISIDGEDVYFTTRFAGNVSKMKSKNRPKEDGFHSKDTVLFNYDNVVGQPLVALVEGPFDAMAFDHAVGLLGKSISDSQVALIGQLAKRGLRELVITLDAEAGRDAIAIYRKLVGHVAKVTVLFLPEGDPHDLRERLPKLLSSRREPTAADFVRHRAMVKHAHKTTLLRKPKLVP